MDLGLSDKVFVVTGGSEGIGGAITRGLLEEGAKVVIATVAKEPTERLQVELDPEEMHSLAVIGDLMDPQQCEKVIHQTIRRFGRLDGLINNAGVNDGAGLDAGPKAFLESLKRNLGLVYDLTHFALPQLKVQGGVIINIGSKVGFTGQGGTSGYAASKAAILGLTREWALELAPFGIRVNTVIPAEVMTPMYQRWLESQFDDPEEEVTKIGAKIPLGKRMTLPEEIAHTVLFLSSPRSSHTTGQWVTVDGGYVHLDRI